MEELKEYVYSELEEIESIMEELNKSIKDEVEDLKQYVEQFDEQGYLIKSKLQHINSSELLSQAEVKKRTLLGVLKRIDKKLWDSYDRKGVFYECN